MPWVVLRRREAGLGHYWLGCEARLPDSAGPAAGGSSARSVTTKRPPCGKQVVQVVGHGKVESSSKWVRSTAPNKASRLPGEFAFMAVPRGFLHCLSYRDYW